MQRPTTPMTDPEQSFSTSSSNAGNDVPPEPVEIDATQDPADESDSVLGGTDDELESSALQAEQAGGESDSSPADAPKKRKKLTSGKEAAAKTSSSLSSQGVATSGTLATTRKGKAGLFGSKKDQAGESVEAFDPAADLPMYREGMNWFVLRVASNKESSVRETLLRKVQIEGMEHLVGRIMVPTEKSKTLKGGKTRITETKLYPGYVFVEMKLEPDGRIPQDVFFLIKETTGVGDFVGTAGRPTPMAPHEVEKMLFDSRRPEEMPAVRMEFMKGDHVTIKEGPFQSYEGTVDEVLPEKGLVRVLVTIFGRQAPIELEYWQIIRAEG